jgi:hypothetical protein
VFLTFQQQLLNGELTGIQHTCKCEIEAEARTAQEQQQQQDAKNNI